MQFMRFKSDFTSYNIVQRAIIAIALCLSLSLCAQTSVEKPVPANYYSNCGHIDFDKIDEQDLTKEERIAKHNKALNNGLNQTEKCMQQATQAGAEKLAQQGMQGNHGSASGQNGAGDATSTESAEQQSDQQQSSQQQTEPNNKNTKRQSAKKSKSHTSGEPGKGNSAVCDAVKQGLNNAQTEAEKAHFEKLKREYGCK